ncbi:MAG: sn-glycerol-3-phosphate ABC transporter ATP-binding protein UgpC [Myxococcota bacterium]
MASVTIRHIKKSYDEHTHVLKGVDLEIDDGEFLVLLGPSGCGKSTLLRTIAGLEDLTSGEILIDGRVVHNVAPRDRGVGIVFQSYALHPHLTVEENMAFGLKVRKTEQRVLDERVGEVSEVLGLSDILERYPKQLSSGQRQCVAMGRALALQPNVILFDEPLSNLDITLRTRMREELKKLHQRLNTTMIYVTHDQAEAMTLADRIAVLERGVLQQVGTPDEIYHQPANAFVASFIGSPAMNFFRGRVAGDVYVGEGFSLPLHDTKAPYVKRVGVRPQHLILAPPDGGQSRERWGEVRATVDALEFMGWEAHLHVHVGEQAMIAHVHRDHASDPKVGDTLRFVVAPRHIHCFDTSDTRL